MSDLRQPPQAAPFERGDEPSTLVELARYRAARQPRQVAFTFLDESGSPAASLSFGEVDRRARAIAARLQQADAAGERVLLLYPAGLEFHVAFLGCLYAGAIAVPAYPPRMNRNLERLLALMGDAGARIVLTTDAILSRLRSEAVQVPGLNDCLWLDAERIQAGEGDWRDPRVGPDALAFLQYTSGSTGTPRGVRLTHSNLLHNARLIYEAVGHTPADKYVSWLPTFHDMGFMAGLLQPLYAGIPAVLMSPVSFLQSPWLWLQAISTHGATISGGPNFAYQLCVRRVSPELRAGLDLSSWTVAFNGAEPIRSATLDDFAATFRPQGFRQTSFFPCYGLAEATLIVSGERKGAGPTRRGFDRQALERSRAVESEAAGDDRRTLVSCGRALGDQQVIVVEPHTGVRCGSGQVGEIWVSGPSVADGYWMKPEQNKEVFGARPGGEDGATFLRTGDLGFLLGGELYVTGRLKDLIIIRGANHYPQDIEQTVEQSHPALRPGCGAAFSVELEGEERLVVVQEVENRKEADADSIVERIRQSVSAEHDLQTHSVVLIRKGTIPKTSSGKIQRYACRAAFLRGDLKEVARDTLSEPEPAPAPGESGEASFILKALLSLPPGSRRTLLELYLQEQVGRLLKSPAGGLSNDRPLATYGLDSLNAAELKSAVERDLRASLPLPRILDGATLSDIAGELLPQVEATAAAAGSPAPRPADAYAHQESPLSYMQQSLWLTHQLAPSSPVYNVPLALRISSEVEPGLLRRALQEVVNRHDSLRATFAAREGGPVQVFHERHELSMTLVDAAGWDDLRLNEEIVGSAHSPFDLASGPVFRATLFSRSAREHVLLLCAHHIVTDGWSMWVMLDEVTALYRSFRTGAPASLPELTAGYARFVRRQDETLRGERGAEELAYWLRELDELPALDLPIARRRPPVRTYEGAEHRFMLDAQLAEQLRRLAAEHQTTLYVVLLSVFQTLLHRYTGLEDVAVGSPLHSRPGAEFENSVGCFYNVVVLRADFGGSPTFAELLARTRRKVLGALAHQDYPSHLLPEKLSAKRDPSRPPLFQITFILQKPTRAASPSLFHLGGGGPAAPFGDLRISLLPVERRFARTDLELEVVEAADGLFATLQFNTDLFRAGDIERMAEHYRLLLRAVVADPAQSVSRLPMLSEAQRRQILEQWRGGGGDYSRATTVCELLDERVTKSPEKVVAVHGDVSVTFSQLNERADKVAQLIGRLKR